MKRIFESLVVLIISILLYIDPRTASAFEQATHKAINEYVAQRILNGFSLDQYLTIQLGFQNGVGEKFLFQESKEVWKWIGEGGETEDATWLRSCNHFHDPISNEGYDGILFGILCNGDSSIIWSQKAKDTQDPAGHYSWFDARDYFYKAFTSPAKTDRDKYFAETFRGVGQLMHLVQDISVPAHVRNQAHIGYHYEGFVFKYQNGKVPNPSVTFDSLLTNPYRLDASIFNYAVYDALAPVPISALWDQNKYTGGDWYPGADDIVGLAEYTNANFFSDFTIFQGYTHPKKANTNAISVEQAAEDGKTDKSYYIKGYQSEKLALYSYFANLDISGTPIGWKYTLDDAVYEDYAQKLIPRAVGYSAGLLNYFFRGQIEAVNPAFTSTGTTLKVKNNTPNEAITTPGKFVVSYEYKDSQGNIVVGVSNEVKLAKSIPTGSESTTKYTFTFSQSIPSDAQDIKYWLVFRGKLGSEDDAVVVKQVKKGCNEYAVAFLVTGGAVLVDKQLNPIEFVPQEKILGYAPSPSYRTNFQQPSSYTCDDDNRVYEIYGCSGQPAEVKISDNPIYRSQGQIIDPDGIVLKEWQTEASINETISYVDGWWGFGCCDWCSPVPAVRDIYEQHGNSAYFITGGYGFSLPMKSQSGLTVSWSRNNIWKFNGNRDDGHFHLSDFCDHCGKQMISPLVISANTRDEIDHEFSIYINGQDNLIAEGATIENYINKAYFGVCFLNIDATVHDTIYTFVRDYSGQFVNSGTTKLCNMASIARRERDLKEVALFNWSQASTGTGGDDKYGAAIYWGHDNDCYEASNGEFYMATFPKGSKILGYETQYYLTIIMVAPE